MDLTIFINYLHVAVAWARDILSLIPFNQTIVIAVFSAGLAYFIESRSTSRFIIWFAMAVGIFLALLFA